MDSFLGRGWSFPPEFGPTLNEVNMLEQEADIASSLEILLRTAPGERVMLPDYGCYLEDLLFESVDSTLVTLLGHNTKTAIIYYEPRVDVEKVDVDTSRITEGILLIEVIYKVRATNSRFNFVFPFYKEEGTDINLSATINLLPSTP
jgi:uncharacterized protein